MGIDPFTLTMIAAGVSAGGTILSAVQANETAETNAELARRQGEADKDAAVAQAEKIRKAARQQVGQANAAMAASGVSLGEGTPVRINEQIYRDSEEDAYNTILTGTRRQRSANDEAAIMRSQGSNALVGGMINAGSTVLAGAAKAAKWRSPYSYHGDTSGARFSATGADVRARR